MSYWHRLHKHAEHDQKSHGNWAEDAEDEQEDDSGDIEMEFGFTYRGGLVDGDTLQLAALARFGETDNPASAGYILSGGELLDMSGAAEGGTPGIRAYDHRQITEVYPGDHGESMQTFMAQTGAIRLHVADDGEVMASLWAPQNGKQEWVSDTALRKLVEIADRGLILDVWAVRDNQVVDQSVTLPEPTVPLLRRVLFSAGIGESIKYAERVEE